MSKDVKFLIEQILVDVKEGYLVEGISKHAPQWHVDRVKKNPSNKYRRPYSLDNHNTDGGIENVEGIHRAVKDVLTDVIQSIYEGGKVPPAEKLASRIMSQFSSYADTFNHALPSPKDVFAEVNRFLQHRVLKKIKNRESGEEPEYINKADEVALLKVIRSPQFKATIENWCKNAKKITPGRIFLDLRNTIRNNFGRRPTLSSGRLKDI